MVEMKALSWGLGEVLGGLGVGLGVAWSLESPGAVKLPSSRWRVDFGRGVVSVPF